MAQARTNLGCTGKAVSFDVLLLHMDKLLVVQDESLPEWTCVQVSSQSVPLCQADILSAVGWADLHGLYERLAQLVELRGRRRLSPSNNRLVRELLGQSSSALSACAALMRMLHDTAFREGSRDLDREARREVDTLGSLLDEVADKYDATPLLVMAALQAGCFSGVLAAMLQGRDVAELSRRGSLFHQVMTLIRSASRLPDVAQLLATSTRHQGQHVSVLGILSALSPSARALRSRDHPAGRAGSCGGAQGRTDSAVAAAEALEQQRKMAGKVMEAHGLLQAVVESASVRVVAAASAAAPPAAEADHLARIAAELRAAQSAPASAAAAVLTSHGMPANHQPTAGFPASSGLAAAAAGGSQHAPTSYDGRYVQHQRSWSALGDRSVGGMYDVGVAPAATAAYSNASAAPAYALFQNGGSGAGPPVELLYDISNGGLGSAAAAGGAASNQAAQYSVESLRLQRELHRLTQAASAGAGPFVRDGFAHQSQVEGLMTPYDPAVVASTLSYPWRTQEAATAAAQGALYPRQQQPPQQQQWQDTYAVYEAVPAVTTPAGATSADAGSVSQLRSYQQQRGYSVPTTPQRPAAAAAAPPQYGEPQQQQQYSVLQQQQQLLTQHHLQQQQEQQQRHQQFKQRLEELLHQLSGGAAAAATQPTTAATYDSQSYGRYLGGYSVGDAAGDVAVAPSGDAGTHGAAASRARSAARQRMPSPDAAVSNAFGVSNGVGGGLAGEGSILDGGAGESPGYGLQTRQQAWAADPSPWQQTQPQQLSFQPQHPPVRAASVAGGPPVRDPWLYQEAAAAVAPAAGSSTAAAARTGSTARARPLVTEDAGPAAAPPVWSPTSGGGGVGGGRVATAWAAVPAESIRVQQERSRAGASAAAVAGSSRPASTRRGTTYGSRSRRPRSPRGSSSGSASSGSGAAPHTTLRALAADSGLIPGLSRSPRELHQQSEPKQRRPQSAPRTAAQQASAPVQPAASSGSLLDRHHTVERRYAAASDPRVGVAPSARGGSAVASPRGSSAAQASTTTPLQQYGGAQQSSRPTSVTATPTTATTAGGAGGDASYYASSTPSAAAAGSRSPHYASVRTNTSPRSGNSSGGSATAARGMGDVAASTATASTMAAAAELVSPPGGARHTRDGWGAGTTTAVASRQYDMPRDSRSGGGGGAAAMAARHAATQPSARPPSAAPSAPHSSKLRSSGGGAAVARPVDAEDLRSAAAAGTAGTLAAAETLGRRRMAAPLRQSDSPSDDDEDLQRALRISRQEAEAIEAAEAARASMAAAAASAPRCSAAGAGPTHGSSPSDGSDRRALSPSPQQRTVALLPCGAIDEGGGGGKLVGAAVPIAALHQRYAVLNPLLSAKLVSLEDDFPSTRRVAGDGNCFYRAALFALLEHVLAAPDGVMCEQMETVTENFVRRLEAMQEQQQQQQQDAAQATANGAGARSHAATPQRPRCDSGGGAPASPSGSTAGAGAGDPAAVRGGRRLLRLLRTAWFKAADVPEPSDVSSLERLFNHSAHSAEVIRFARQLTVHELTSDEAFYAPFIPGCGGDYDGMTLQQICTRHVLPMGVEVEQLQIIALCRALGATVAVLDVAGSHVGAIKHGPAGHSGPPLAWVAHLPGHYDVVYPAKPMDVAPGGQLVPAEELL